MSDWAKTPIDLQRGAVRRLFAQELVTQMSSIGSATRGELLKLPVLLFKVPPDPDELDQVTEVARRLDWLEKGDASGEEWRVTESGRALRRPPSLAMAQVATRVLSVANPVRTQAKDWLPIVALAAGTVTAGVVRGVDTADAVRALSAAVLLGAVVWQFYGELQIVQAIKSWPRVQKENACRPLKRLYSTPRLVVTAIMDAAVIGAFTLVSFGAWEIGVGILAIAALAGLVHLHLWTIPVAVMVCRFSDCPPSWLLRTSARWLRVTTITTVQRVIESAEVDIAYDVHGPLPTADGRPALLMIGQPMAASGFATLASHFPDRTVVTYDPRGLGRSIRKDGRVDHAPTVQAEDVHSVIEALGAGPVEMFASSGGAVTALALVAAHPDDVVTLVAHEPPLIPGLGDAEAAGRARAGVRNAYEAKGSGAGMAAFIAMTSWRGEFTDEYFAQPAADPVQFGMSSEDDGARDDPLLSDRSWAVSDYRLDLETLAAAPTRVVIAVGEESLGTFTGRSAVATAELLGQQAIVFPSHHGGFLGGEFGYAGQPEAFARKLRAVLDDD